MFGRQREAEGAAWRQRDVEIGEGERLLHRRLLAAILARDDSNLENEEKVLRFERQREDVRGENGQIIVSEGKWKGNYLLREDRSGEEEKQKKEKE